MVWLRAAPSRSEVSRPLGSQGTNFETKIFKFRWLLATKTSFTTPHHNPKYEVKAKEFFWEDPLNLVLCDSWRKNNTTRKHEAYEMFGKITFFTFILFSSQACCHAGKTCEMILGHICPRREKCLVWLSRLKNANSLFLECAIILASRLNQTTLV